MTIQETLPNGNTIEYKIINGTAYHEKTALDIVRILENARLARTRIEMTLGDVQSGRAWGTPEYFEIESGYIGRSMGNIKVPLLIHNSRTIGGPAILDHCIVRIRLSRGKRVLYQHPNYHEGE